MCKFVFTERPAFTQSGEFNLSEEQNGYILQLDVNHMTVSIINLKKGGNRAMIKTVVKALEGFEKQFNEINEMKANLEKDKEVAIQAAIAEVEEKFVEKSERLDKVLALVSVTEEIEVPDEEEPSVTEDTAQEVQTDVIETLY